MSISVVFTATECMKKLIHKFSECSQQSYILFREIRGNIHIHIEVSYENDYFRTDSKIKFGKIIHG